MAVIAVTGFGLIHEERNARAAGFADYLLKPLDPTALAAAPDQVWLSAAGAARLGRRSRSVDKPVDSRWTEYQLTTGAGGEMVATSRRKAMRHETVPDNPMCPLCELEVLPSDNVIFAHGEIVHIKCPLKSDGITDSVAHLLRRNAGAEYCQICVARLLHSTYEQAMKAVTALRMTSRYRVRAMGTCSICGHHWMTVRAEPPWKRVGGASARR